MLAYSTISQLGFMFLAVGSARLRRAIFLLVAHAFYKALLFLRPGAVIHGLHDEQDMTKMGGLRRAMPFTAVTIGIGALAHRRGPAPGGLLREGPRSSRWPRRPGTGRTTLLGMLGAVPVRALHRRG